MTHLRCAQWLAAYRPRSVDALRQFLALIEKHILEKAGIVFDATAEPGKLRVVTS